jgi:hypothetical protein
MRMGHVACRRDIRMYKKSEPKRLTTGDYLQSLSIDMEDNIKMDLKGT